MILDRSCTILFINTAAARFIGEKQEFINGKKFGDIVPGDLPEKMIPTIHNVFFYRTEASYT